MNELLLTGAGLSGLLAILIARSIYRGFTNESTVTLTRTCDDSYIVRVRVGFSLPRYVRTSMGATCLGITHASNFRDKTVAEDAGRLALAQLGCRWSTFIQVRNIS